MEPTNPPSPSEWSASLRHQLNSLFKSTRFLGILTWIAAGLLVLFSLVTIVLGGIGVTDTYSALGSTGIILIGLVYIGVAILYYYLGRYLYRASNQFQRALHSGKEEDLHACFSPLTLFFRLVMIISIGVLALYGLALIFGLIAGGIGAFMA